MEQTELKTEEKLTEENTLKTESEVSHKAAPGHTGSSKPAVITVILYGLLVLAAGVITAVRTVQIVTAAGLEVSGSVLASVFTGIGMTLAVLTLSAAVLVPVLFARRRKLYHFRYSDLFLILGLAVLFYIGNSSYNSFILGRMSNALGVSGAVTTSVGESVFAMVLPAAFVGAVAIASFVLARTKARTGAIIFTAAASWIFLLDAIVVRKGAEGLAGYYLASPEHLENVVRYIRGAAVANALTAILTVVSALFLGLSTKRPVWGFTGILLLALTQLFVGIVAGVLLVETFGLGVRGMIITSYTKPFAYFIGMLLPLAGMLSSRKNTEHQEDMMEITNEILQAILDAYVYEIVFVDRTHTVRYMNKAARARYGNVVKIGASLFNCHNGNSKGKIEEFLKRADAGENEMFEVLNGSTGEREFFVPVRDAEGKVIGYYERHENHWSKERPDEPVTVYEI